MSTEKSEPISEFYKEKMAYGSILGTTMGSAMGYGYSEIATPSKHFQNGFEGLFLRGQSFDLGAPIPKITPKHLFGGAYLGLVTGVVLVHFSQHFQNKTSVFYEKTEGNTRFDPMLSTFSTGFLGLDYMLKGSFYGAFSSVSLHSARIIGMQIALRGCTSEGVTMAVKNTPKALSYGIATGAVAGLLLFSAKKAHAIHSASKEYGKAEDNSLDAPSAPENRC